MAADGLPHISLSKDRFDRLTCLAQEIRSCRLCLKAPIGAPLPHEPRPVFIPSSEARICIIGQAPGTLVHFSGQPFTDPSGDRLRTWMDIGKDDFYNDKKIAIIPMGFCFPGQDKKGGDLPPRKECASRWHEEIFGLMPQIELTLLVGLYAQHRYLGKKRQKNLTETVRHWRDYLSADDEGGRASMLPMPHPSWRNNAWLRENPFFERDVVPFLRQEARRLIASD